MLKIESAQNETFKTCLSLISSKGLRKEGLFLLSGERLIHEFLKNPTLRIHFELVPPGAVPLTSGDKESIKYIELSSELFDQLDVLGTHYNILVLEQPVIARLNAAELSTHKPEGVEVVIPIGDPGNLGALLRSCEAFGVPRAILTQESAHPFLPKTVKASAGSVLRLPFVYGPSLSEFPESCMALDMTGTPLGKFTWPENGLLVVGEEGAGLGATKFRHRIRIPTQGVESLNAIVAASIALAHKARVL